MMRISGDFPDFPDVLTHFVTIFSDTDEKSFLVMNDLLVLNAIQAEMASTQNRTWANVQERFDVFEQNFHIHRDCIQMLFSNQQLNFNFDALCSLLAMIHASIKSYPSALFAYRMNLLNAIPVLLRSHLPMSLTPMDSLIVILESVAIQSKAADRLSLAIPLTDVLSYYDSRLLADAITVPEGFLLTLNIPLASHQTGFTIFRQNEFHCLIQMTLKWF